MKTKIATITADTQRIKGKLGESTNFLGSGLDAHCELLEMSEAQPTNFDWQNDALSTTSSLANSPALTSMSSPTKKSAPASPNAATSPGMNRTRMNGKSAASAKMQSKPTSPTSPIEKGESNDQTMLKPRKERLSFSNPNNLFDF